MRRIPTALLTMLVFHSSALASEPHASRLGQCQHDPVAPMTADLAFPAQVAAGQPIGLSLIVTLTEEVPNATTIVEFQVPPQMALVGGAASQETTLAVGQPQTFLATVSVNQQGRFEISATAIAGNDDYRFGKRITLYVDSGPNGVTLSRTKPVAAQSGPPAPIGPGDVVTHDPNGGDLGEPPLPDSSTVAQDPKGRPLPDTVEPPVEGGIAAAVTVTGTWGFRHSDGTVHDGYGSIVRAWDDDTGSADDLMATGYVDGSGNFSLTFDNADGEGGTADVYLEFRTDGAVVQTHTNAGATAIFSTATGVLFPNIGSGTFNAGGWFADWGTNGVADANERAWEVHTTMSYAWEFANYTLGHDAHAAGVTFVQWYDGSFDGSYYDPPTDRIHLDEADFSSPDVLMHEYGHSLMDSVYGEVWIPGAGGAHTFTGHYNPALAWSEGWATWFSCSAQGNDWIYESFDPDNLVTFNCDSNWDGNGSANGNSDGLSNNPNWGYDTESAVLSMLLDLDDSRNDSTDLYDWTSLGDNEIFDVTLNYDPPGANPDIYSVQQFFDGWYSRGWGWRPQLNGQMEVHGMDQGISRPTIGIYDGVDRFAGTWYYGGYGRGSFDVKNYGSQDYDLNQMYVWLRGPGGQDIGQFGGDGDGTVIPERTTRNIWRTADQTGYNAAAPNFVYGLYTITAGHYRSDNVWQLLEPAESGTATQISVNVIEDTDAPDYCNVVDDGCMGSQTQLHIIANAADSESSIKSYWTRVGTAPYAGDEQDWVEHAANNVTTFDYTITGLSMSANVVYYVTVVARNIEGYDTWSVTDGIVAYDSTPPGAVTVTDDGECTDSTTQLHVVATSSETNGCIHSYWTRVGTLPGLGDEQDWVQHVVGDTDVFDYTISGLSMTEGTTYYVTIVARNYSGFDTFGYSNGILNGCACDPCDVNCNGTVNQFDIPPFVELISTHAGCSPCAGDMDGNGTANTFDINGFLDCLIP